MGNINICPKDFFQRNSDEKSNQINPLELNIATIKKEEPENVDNNLSNINLEHASIINSNLNNNVINNTSNEISQINYSNQVKNLPSSSAKEDFLQMFHLSEDSNLNDFTISYEINKENNNQEILCPNYFTHFFPSTSSNESTDTITNETKLKNYNNLHYKNSYRNKRNSTENNNLNFKSINNEKDSITLQNIIYIQCAFRNYIIKKKERIYNNLKSINTSSMQKVDHRLQNVISYLRNDYKILYPKRIKKHSKEGLCVLKWKDNSFLKGIYHNNKLNGVGIIYLSDKTEYMGYFKNNKFNGFGIYYSSDQTKIKGNWINGKINGIVEEKFKDGTIFQGEYINGYRNGIGTYFYSDGSIFIGEFKNHKMNGFGQLKYYDNKKYEGEFENNLFNGYGEFTWQKGEIYYGFWKEGYKNLFGIYIDKNKKISYIGFWNNNKQSGIGAIYNDNSVKFGKWDNGKKVKNFLSYDQAMNDIPKEYTVYKDFFFKTRDSATILFY